MQIRFHHQAPSVPLAAGVALAQCASRADSEPVRGAQVPVSFSGRPEMPVASPTTAARPVRRPATGNGQRILVVDDDPAVVMTFQNLLQRLNYVVSATNRPSEGIAWCRENPERFDLVITDFAMPEMNGLALAYKLHALRPELPVLLASGTIPSFSREEMAVAGITELLEKPFGMEILAATLQRIFAA